MNTVGLQTKTRSDRGRDTQFETVVCWTLPSPLHTGGCRTRFYFVLGFVSVPGIASLTRLNKAPRVDGKKGYLCKNKLVFGKENFRTSEDKCRILQKLIFNCTFVSKASSRPSNLSLLVLHYLFLNII